MAADKRKGVIAPPLQSLGQEHAKEAGESKRQKKQQRRRLADQGPPTVYHHGNEGWLCEEREREKNGVFHGRLRDDLHRCLGNKRSNEARDHRTTFLASFSSPLSSLPPHVHDLVSCSRPRPCHLTERKLPIMSE